MRATFVDSSVVLDALTGDPVWMAWSRSEIERAESLGPLWINGIVYVESGHRFDRMEQLDLALSILKLQVIGISNETFFEAAKAFRVYRARGGSRSAILPDFIIGAHAWMLDVPLLTRDPKRFRRAFPDLVVMAPDLK